ncbi:MAG: glycosyltransferase, partial [Bacteroidota bacterium]|nr:glycosyltransferase [Bacteroidota bacterium]
MTNKTTIAVFIDWFLPGYKAGGPITSLANMIGFLKNDFNFLIITSNTDYLEREPYPNIDSDKWINFDTNIKVYYFSKENLTRKNVEKIIKNTNFDIAYINGIYSYYFSILPLFFLKKTDKKTVVATRGMLSEQAFSSKSFKKKIFLYFAKFIGFYRNITFHATNIDEAKNIKQIISKNSIIKLASNLPEKRDFKLIKRTKNNILLKLVSIARISPEKNTKFALEQLQNINNCQIIFDLYGSIYDENYWKECLKIIEQLPKNISINYKGTIKKSFVNQTFSKYHFSFMPSKGENFGHSILESFMSGTPVITSSNTPWKELEQMNVGW